jgi:hypothetical protein
MIFNHVLVIYMMNNFSFQPTRFKETVANLATVARVCSPLLCLCRPFCIFGRCLMSGFEPTELP